MSMLLYSKTGSPFAQRVKMALAYKGVAYRDHVHDPAQPLAGFSTLTPIGRAPVLLDGSTVVRELNVILEYIEARLAGRPLMPESAAPLPLTRIVVRHSARLSLRRRA